MTSKAPLYLIQLLIALVSAAGCKPIETSELKSKTLLYCSEGSPESFNPQLVTSGTTIDAVSQQLYNRLVKIDPTSGRIVSDLARKVIVSEDAMRYRFYLRKDVQFHHTDYFTPSRELNSDDVIFTFSRLLDPQNPYNKVGGGIYPFFDGIGFADNIKQLIQVDDLTIEFRLFEPQASFLANLATDFAVILSSEYADTLAAAGHKERLDRNPIGTGPFKYSEYKRDHYIRYKRHDSYWDQPASIEQLIFDITPNNSNRVTKLLTKECDVLGYPSSADVQYLSEKSNIKLDEATSMNVSYWAFNTNQPPFDQPLVRKALSYVVDRQAIIDAVYFGQAQAAYTLIPPLNWGHTDASSEAGFSLSVAKQLLVQAGYPNGFNMTIWAMPVQRVYNPNAHKMAEILQANLAKIGVTATIVSYDWSTFRKKLAKGEHDTVLIGWQADNSDPDNFYRPLLSCAAAFSGSNRSAWCDDDYDQNIYQALAVTDESARKEFYSHAERRILNQVPLVPIAHANRYKVHQNYVDGIELNPFGGIGFGQAFKKEPK